jgi:hypothetical protein
MIDLQAKLEQFETLIAECELIAKLATDKAKRELYLRLAIASLKPTFTRRLRPKSPPNNLKLAVRPGTQPLGQFRPSTSARDVAHRDGDGLSLADQYNQPLSTCDAGVEKVPLQHGVVLCHDGDDYGVLLQRRQSRNRANSHPRELQIRRFTSGGFFIRITRAGQVEPFDDQSISTCLRGPRIRSLDIPYW